MSSRPLTVWIDETHKKVLIVLVGGSDMVEIYFTQRKY